MGNLANALNQKAGNIAERMGGTWQNRKLYGYLVVTRSFDTLGAETYRCITSASGAENVCAIIQTHTNSHILYIRHGLESLHLQGRLVCKVL